jgi:hypothetical protein
MNYKNIICVANEQFVTPAQIIKILFVLQINSLYQQHKL